MSGENVNAVDADLQPAVTAGRARLACTRGKLLCQGIERSDDEPIRARRCSSSLWVSISLPAFGTGENQVIEMLVTGRWRVVYISVNGRYADAAILVKPLALGYLTNL